MSLGASTWSGGRSHPATDYPKGASPVCIGIRVVAGQLYGLTVVDEFHSLCHFVSPLCFSLCLGTIPDGIGPCQGWPAYWLYPSRSAVARTVPRALAAFDRVSSSAGQSLASPPEPDAEAGLHPRVTRASQNPSARNGAGRGPIAGAAIRYGRDVNVRSSPAVARGGCAGPAGPVSICTAAHTSSGFPCETAAG